MCGVEIILLISRVLFVVIIFTVLIFWVCCPHNRAMKQRSWILRLVGFLTTILILGVFTNTVVFNAVFPLLNPIDPTTISGEFDSGQIDGEYLGRTVFSKNDPSVALAKVLGSNDLPKRIEVDLANQRVYAYEGPNKVYDFLISSGKWGRTPTGTFRIWGKFRYTKMSGGNPLLHTYYYLPNVPFVMFFSNDKVAASRGFSLHGTYWHSNFGHPMSHGCVNMKTEEAGILFYWSQPSVGDKKTVRSTANDLGTEVIIYGEAPAK